MSDETNYRNEDTMKQFFIATLFPKLLLTIISLSISTSVSSQEEMSWYTFGGLALHSEDTDAAVGAGVGPNAGVGIRFNNMFGLEAQVNRSPAMEPEDFWDAFAQVYDVSDATGYEIKLAGNLSFTLAGTLTIPMQEKLSGILKIGYSQISFGLDTFNLTVEESESVGSIWDGTYRRITYETTYDITDLFEDSENGFFVSGGLLIDVNEKNQFELSVSQISLDEGKSLSVNGSWRYRF